MPSLSPSIPRLGAVWLYTLALVICAAGLFFAAAGGRLVKLGGSWYFLLAGLALIVSAAQIARGRPSGAVLFGAIFLATVVWSLFDVGIDFWPLVSRLLAMTVGACVVALSFPLLRRAAGRTPMPGPALARSTILGLVAAGTIAGMFVPHTRIANGRSTPLICPSACALPQDCD